MTEPSITAALSAQKALPLFTCGDGATGLKVLAALHAGGIRIVEFTNRTPAALDVFRDLMAAAAKQMAAQEQEDVSAIAKLKTRAQMLASQLSKEIEVVPSRGDTERVGVGMILRSRRLTGGKAKERAQAVSEQLSGKLKLEQAPPVASVQAPRGG